MRLNNRGNWSLMGLLVVVAIIGVGIYFMFGKVAGMSTVKSDSQLVDQASKKQTIYGRSMDTAKGTDCQEHLNQIRLGINTFKISDPNGANPPSLKDIRMGVGPDYFKCPVSGQAYIYDPATGAVRCPYPSHAKF